MIHKNLQNGITLIETLVYTAIFSMFILTLASFSDSIQTTRLRNQSILEVHSQGSSAIRIMTYTIRNAVQVNSPVISNSGTSISLETIDPLTNPTIFMMATGTLYMQEGTGDPVALTNNRVEVQSLVFSNFSRVSTPDTIKIRFSLKNSDLHSRTGEQYSKDFYGSASIK
jgi:type II secretory pathway pseudopilin PulG